MSRKAVAVLLLLSALDSGPVSAHADYEGPVGTVTGSRGETYTLFLHYTDGIVAVDPVKLVVRDATGRPVSETPYVRGLVLRELPDGRVLAFAVDIRGLSFWEGWAVEDGNLVPLPQPEHTRAALRAHLGYNWLEYGFSAAVCGAAILLGAARLRRGPTWSARFHLAASLAFVWVGFLLLHGPLSLLLVAGLTLAGTLPFVWLIPRRRPSRGT